MHTEETMTIESFLQMSQTYRREETIGTSLEIGIVITGHNVTNIINIDENLFSAFFYRNSFGFLSLCMQLPHVHEHELTLAQDVLFQQAYQIVNSINL